MFSNFWKSVVGEEKKPSSSTGTSPAKDNNNNNNNTASSSQHNQSSSSSSTSTSKPKESFFERFEKFAQAFDLDDGNDGNNNNNSYNTNNNNVSASDTRKSIPNELVEIDREWSAINRYFDAAIIGEAGGDEASNSDSYNDLSYALSSQLSELDAKLKRIVALIYCGGRLPSAFAKTLKPGAVVRWDKIPNPTNNRTEQALRRCREEGVSIFSFACQYAKQNLPPGSRSVLSSFMLEMLAMMEVSSNWVSLSPSVNNSNDSEDSKNSKNNKNNNNKQPHRIGDVLVENRHTVCQPLVNFIAKTVQSVIRTMQFTHHEEEKNEKLYFARLIRYLCESVAHQGERLLALPSTDYDDDDDDDKNDNDENKTLKKKQQQQPSIRALADSGQLSLPWLLDVVQKFSRADDLYPVAPAALDHALRAYLSLAVSKFDIVGASNMNTTFSSNEHSNEQQQQEDIFDSLFSHLGFTFVTLCRLEDDQDFNRHLSIISTTMKFLDSLFIFAPHVVDGLDIPSRFFKFLLGTVSEMVKLPSDRSYIVSMLVLSQMMENWSGSVPGQSPIPTLIAQSILCHNPEVTEAFFGRLSDISVKVRTAAGNFLVAALRSCPMLLVSMIGNGMKKSNNNNKNTTASPPLFILSSDNIGDLFPSATNMLIHDEATVKVCTTQYEHARSKIIFSETRRTEQAPGLKMMMMSANEQNGDEQKREEDGADENEESEFHCQQDAGKEFIKLCEFFVKNLRRALSYDLQQYTTYDSSHCAVLSGIIIELLSLPQPPSSSSSTTFPPLLFVQGILRDSLPSISQHVTARLGRIEGRTKNTIEDIVQHSTGSANTDAALDAVKYKVPDEFKAFARGAVHLAHLRLEIWSILRAKEEQQRLREIDPDE